MFTYLSDNNELFNETQHGFRGGRSCLSALLDVFDDIMNMLGKDPSVDMVYMLMNLINILSALDKRYLEMFNLTDHMMST